MKPASTLNRPDCRSKLFALYLRYQTTNERAFHKCLADLLKLRSEKRKEQNGFKWQKRLAFQHKMKLDYHELELDYRRTKTRREEADENRANGSLKSKKRHCKPAGRPTPKLL